MNLTARQNYATVRTTVITYNTIIGGVSTSIPNAATLASKLAISIGVISNFTIEGNNIKCNIAGSYAIPTDIFSASFTPVTFYTDSDYLITNVGARAFKNTTAFKGKIVDFKNSTDINLDAFWGTYARGFLLKNAINISASAFKFSEGAEFYYIPSCTNLGGTSGYNNVFETSRTDSYIYCHPSLATNNAGGEDGDIADARTRGCNIRFVNNYTLPNAVTTLSSGTIYTSAIQLNFTAPTGSANAIDYYEVYVNGVYLKKITASGDYATGFNPSTNYNITVVSVDVFYNKSVVSNTLNVSTNTTEISLSGLISSYYLESNSNDNFGTNHGVDTAVTYGVGKIGNCAIYNGSTSKSVIGNPTNTQITSGTVACWFKTSGAGSSYRSIFGKQNAFNIFAVDEVLGVYSWAGSAGFKSTGIKVNDGQWHHIAYVFQSGTTTNKLYLDGVLVSVFAMSIASQGSIVIGSNGSSQQFNGSIDGAIICNTKLSDLEISGIVGRGNRGLNAN